MHWMVYSTHLLLALMVNSTKFTNDIEFVNGSKNGGVSSIHTYRSLSLILIIYKVVILYKYIAISV